MKRDGRARIVLCSTVLVLVVMAGQTMAALVRGPYLQNGTSEGVTIMWRTSSNESSKVWYGTSLGSLNLTVTDATVETNHKIQITGLPPAAKYFYQIGRTDGTVLAGGDADHYFVTSPVVGSIDPVRIWVLGDSGTANSSARAVRDAYLELAGNEKEADIWLMLGDNAYNSGTENEYQNAVFDTYPQILKNKVLWSTRGNHEASASVYYGIFDLPTLGEGGGLASGTESYYSFDYGNVHFICLNSQESGYSSNPGSAMYVWLEQDLADTTQDWIIAFWHHPPYSKGSHNSDSESKLIYMRQYALPILEAGGVDLVLSGHSHAYERSYFLNGHYGSSGSFDSNTHVVQAGDGKEDGDDGAYQKCDLDGAVYIVAGSSGKTSGGSLNHAAMYVSFNSLGSLIIDVDNSRLDSRFLREYTGPTQINDYFTIEFATCVTDETAPTPDPMEWLTLPYATGTTSISMTAATATDDYNGVEYYFACTAGGGNDSVWQSGSTYEDTGLTPNREYTYQVFARDTSPDQWVTDGSGEESARTDIPEPGDLNDSGDVNLFDAYLFGLEWGRLDCLLANDWCGFADIAPQDGVVDGRDFGRLAGNYWQIVVTQPVVVNQAASDITSSTAVLNGEITSTGNEDPTVIIYWGETDGEDTGPWDNSEDLGTRGLGAFSTSIGTLSNEMTYYYRCYASNSAGGVWAGSTETFDTLTAMPIALDIRVSARNDDAEETISSGWLDSRGSSDLELGWEGNSGDLKLVGMRFNNIDIPNGAPITSAYIEFTVDETDSGVCNLTVFGQLSPDVPSEFPSDTWDELSGRPRTIAEVDWTAISAWSPIDSTEQTPDLTSIISEITGQAGWNPGNSLVLFVEPDAVRGTSDKRVAKSYDRDGGANAPLLHIEYSGSVLEPVVVNQAASGLTASAAVLNGEITSTGGQNPTVTIYWGQTDEGTNAGAWGQSEDLGTQGLGAFSTSIGTLTAETTYYYRCYASNAAGGVWAASTETFDTRAQGSAWYSENFDSIGPTGTAMPTGWLAGGAVGNLEERDPPEVAYRDEALYVDNGSSDTRGRSYNYGTTGDSDRAVGQMPTSASGDRGIQVALVNDTGAPITVIEIRYTGEQWKNNQGSLPDGTENLRMYISDAADFSGNVEKLPPAFVFTAIHNTGGNVTLDGNLPANRVENIGGEYTLITPIAAGANFYISWHDYEDNATADHALAIDDVVIILPGTSSLVEYFEDFETGFSGNIGNHADWYSNPGPAINSAGVAGSVGLSSSGNIFTWTAHPFSWTDDLAVGDVVIMGMDFEAASNLDDDRVGWMIKDDTSGSDNIFGVQADPKSGGGENIECYWDDVSFGDNGGRQTIVDTTPVNDTWYRMTSTFTKLTDTSCSIDVEFVELDGSGNPTGTPVTGSIADTSALANDPMVQYFNGLPGYSNTLWPAYKNHQGGTGNADNAYFAIGTP